MSAQRGYYRHPTIHGDRIAFVTEDDLWVVDAGGGTAHRVTANPGSKSFPRFSPDGARLAFTSRDEGHPEAYVMDVDGGSPERLTYLGCTTQVVAWRPDGEAVVVASDTGQPFQGYHHLLDVRLDGGPPSPVHVGPARAISFQRPGSGVVIGRNSLDPARWKRYRGGRTGTLWIDREGAGEFVRLLDLPGNLADPMWIGRRIFFLSDHEGIGNLYSCTPTGRGLRRHTHLEDFYVRFPSSDGRRIVFHAGADLFVFDPRSNRTDRLEIGIPSARPQRNRRFMAPGKFLEHLDLSPGGEAIAVVARGGVYSMSLWEGAPHRHTEPSAARHRLARWQAEGDGLVAVSDVSGEEAIVSLSTEGVGHRLVTDADIGRPFTLTIAPAGRARAALTNHRYEAVIVDLDSGAVDVVHRSPHSWIAGAAWSPDGRWLAFSAYVSRTTAAIHLLDTTTGEITRITSGEFIDTRPAFDPLGRYLLFVSARVFDPVPDTPFHDYGFPRGTRPFLIPLQEDRHSPFSVAHRPARRPGAPPPDDAKENGETPPVSIDLDGIEDRVVALPVPEGRYGRVLGAKGRFLFSSYPVEGRLGEPGAEPQPTGRLEAYDLSTDKVETVAERISDFAVSADGETLAIVARSNVRVVPAGFKNGSDKAGSDPGRESGWLDLDRIRVVVDPPSEWRQMFREAWRLQRDQFWTADMSDVDWTGVHDRYLPLVDRVGSRAEFSDLMWEMQGELGTSHAYEMGGDYRPEPKWFQGMLGADLELDVRSGAWKIARIPQGDSWAEQATSPLAAPGVGVRQGDRLVAVDGVAVDGATHPGELLIDRAARPVTLTVRTGRRKARTVTVTALRHEFSLRYRDWVRRNRRTVAERSGGRVGYVHIPDMGPAGFGEFHRSWLAEVDLPGLVIDVRFNRGGNVSQLLLEKLLRRRIGYRVTRWGTPYAMPTGAPMGPMAALTNEYAGSDGDIFSHTFKLSGLGPLVGTRTWGGVIGIWPRHALVDGSVTTQPEFATWFPDVGWQVENYGTDPDIVVEITPSDHAAGRDPQLERGVAEVLSIIDRTGDVVPEFGERPSRRPPRMSPDG